MPPPLQITIIGAGINGLVAANYLARAGHAVTLLERADRVGGACVAATAEIDGHRQDYALGASVLGLMQDFVWRETGLADRLTAWAPDQPKLVFFPGEREPVLIHRDPAALDREFARRLGERGDAAAFRADEARVVAWLQDGYRAARAPSLAEARAELGTDLARLWISGSARGLLEHYFTAERVRTYMAMTVTESGPVSLSEPWTAFTIPMMDSGSVFGGYYGYVRGGIWQVTEELARINRELGVRIRLESRITGIDPAAGTLEWESPAGGERSNWDELLLATDPLTAARLIGDGQLRRQVENQRLRGSAGKLNLLFRHPVRWREGPAGAAAEAAFRFVFAEDTLDGFEAAAAAVADGGTDYRPGYAQVYCEGAAMRHMGLDEPFDRLAVFFNFLGLERPGQELPEVEARIREAVLARVANPEDCAWSRLLTPADLRATFGFPAGNLDHTMLVGGQTFADRGYAPDPEHGFYRFGGHAHVHLCGAGAYPCGSVAGTPGYMCARQLLRARQ